jgi:hypothetical protein
MLQLQVTTAIDLCHAALTEQGSTFDNIKAIPSRSQSTQKAAEPQS